MQVDMYSFSAANVIHTKPQKGRVILRGALIVFLFFPLLLPCLSFAEPKKKVKTIKLKHKNDVVVMENGDRNTGEIKKLDFGVLYLKSDRVADTLKLDWKRVIRVQSIARYEFETRQKELYIGVIQADPNGEAPAGILRILLDHGPQVEVPIADVISIREIGRSFLSRMNISIDAGMSYTSANNRGQSNINFSGTFNKPRYSGSLDLSSQFSGEPGTEKTSRHEAQLVGRRFIRKRLDALFLAAFLHDKQQDLDLRTTLGGGLEGTLYESNRTIFTVIGGVVYTKEKYSVDESTDRNNAEALGALRFATYRFRGSSLSTQISVFPNLSDPGRIRVDGDFEWKWDIVMDLYWKIGITNNYDNRPPPGGINHNLSITSTVGWSF
jgi:hypothetical protein